MAAYIMALTIKPNAKQEHPALSHHINDSIEVFARHDIHIDNLLATLGRFDFLALFESTDQTKVFRAASDINNLGILETETWPVIPFDEFTSILE